MRYNIEFVRFVFTIAILLCHASLQQHSGQNCAASFVANGALSVDFFFIIAGFFLYTDINNKKLSTREFLIKKYIRLASVCFFSLVCHIIAFYFGLIKQSVHFRHEFLNLLFLREVGINSFTSIPLENGLWATNTHLWYLGPLFYVSAFFHYMLTHFNKKRVNAVFAVLTFLGVGLYYKGITLCFGALIRGFVGIGMGYFLRAIEIKYQENNYTFKWGGAIWTFLELYAIGEIFLTLFVRASSFELNYYFMILFCVLLLSFYQKRGLVSKFLDNRFFGFMGKYCYSIYVMQWIVQNIIGNGNKLLNWPIYSQFRQLHPSWELLFSLLIIIFLGVFTYYFVELRFRKFLEKRLFR